MGRQNGNPGAHLAVVIGGRRLTVPCTCKRQFKSLRRRGAVIPCAMGGEPVEFGDLNWSEFRARFLGRNGRVRDVARVEDDSGGERQTTRRRSSRVRVVLVS